MVIRKGKGWKGRLRKPCRRCEKMFIPWSRSNLLCENCRYRAGDNRIVSKRRKNESKKSKS